MPFAKKSDEQNEESTMAETATTPVPAQKETIESKQARLLREQRELAKEMRDASMVDDIEMEDMRREGRIDETIPGGYYLEGGRWVGGKLVGARAVDANGNPVKARK